MKHLRQIPCILLLLALCGLPVRSQGQEEAVSPKALLTEAIEVARTVPPKKNPYGDWCIPLLFLRIGETMQLNGMKDEAAAAYAECLSINAKCTEEAIRNEIIVETCRDIARLGQMEQARALAKGIKSRNYSAIAEYLIARTALEMGDAAAAEQIIRSVPAMNRSTNAKPDKREDLWTRGLVRLAVRMNKLDLARSLAAAMQSEPWRSGALGAIAVALGEDGKVDDALKAASEIPDPYMAVLGCARLIVAFAKITEARSKASGLLNAAADKIENGTAHDYALLFAVRRLSAAGLDNEAGQIVAKVKDPGFAVRARCEIVTAQTFSDAAAAIAACPESERHLLWEALTVSAGRRGLADCALNAAGRIDWPWQRLRALCSVAEGLAEAGQAAGAKQALNAAAECVGRLDPPDGRLAAHIRLAIAYGDADASDAAAQHLQDAKKELAQIKDPELRDALLPRLIETMIFLVRKDDARAAIMEALGSDPSASVRDRLLPMLVQAGDAAGALAEYQKKRVSDSRLRQLLAYRLAQAGKVKEAVEYARALPVQVKADALADIARVLAPRPAMRPTAEKMVGVTLHGSWSSWFPRLERMGAEWEMMPFFEPYEIGAEGLKAKYIALGYPGTGGHFDHTSAVGVEAVREYIYSGGGYMGICAGQYLATSADLATCRAVHFRGQGPHQVQMRKNHLTSLGLPPVIVIVRHNGGMLIPKTGCEVIGWYDKVDRYVALVAEQVGRGRVVAFSPHPEGSSDFVPRDCLCIQALNWAMMGLP
ncbi:MAG: hypothetical protein AB1696_14980 [Planctomycetota bacterium]